MTNNKAREIHSPIIKQLINETTPEELAKIDTEMTNNKQQTAVEWFANESWQLKVQLDNQEISVDEYAVSYVRLLYKAKEMEKEQAINDYCEGRNSVINKQIISSEQYYEQTYGGNK